MTAWQCGVRSSSPLSSTCDQAVLLREGGQCRLWRRRGGHWSGFRRQLSPIDAHVSSGPPRRVRVGAWLQIRRPSHLCVAGGAHDDPWVDALEDQERRAVRPAGESARAPLLTFREASPLGALMLFELELTKEAFRRAHGRFHEAHSARDLQEWYGGLSETLMWICALDERYLQEFGSTYRAFRKDSPYAHELPGLRWARNRAVHQICLLLVDPLTQALFSPAVDELTLGERIEQLVWRVADELPPAPVERQGKQYLEGKRCYECHLQGHAVRYSLRRMNYFFIRPKGGLDEAMGLADPSPRECYGEDDRVPS
jgi:hypothetical protein